MPRQKNDHDMEADLVDRQERRPKTRSAVLKEQDAAIMNAMKQPQPTTNHSHSPALGDLIIGHNNFVVHPGDPTLYIGAITKTPQGYKGRKYREPVTAERIREGNVPCENHNAIKRSSIAQVRFVILHMHLNGVRESEAQSADVLGA